MDKISKAQAEFREMDAIAAGGSLIHQMHPLCKLVVTVVYIFTVVSFHKYDLSGLAVMVLYPVFLFQAAQVPMRMFFYKLRIVLPLVCAVGLVNPFLDHRVLLQVGDIVVTGGVISMLTLMMKGCFALMASFLLIATTPVDALCAALRKIRVPGILVTLFLLTYRYIGVMMDETAIMVQAYSLRAPRQKGVHFSAWGSFLGQMLLRSMDRAQELYSSMVLRGFKGDFYYSDIPACRVGSILFMVASLCFFVCARLVRITQLIGSLFVG
ncbi:MAG: cobalt ECF transporter T component CbiQ [Lachnospiraceae bacterium]|nr:cobalt ECF transporter T component CbiQ [Lachnospiraceae bacterium]